MTDTVREAGESAELVAEISAWEDPPRAASPELGAGSRGRWFRGAARLAAGDGAGPENRSGAPVNRVPHRRVRNCNGSSTRSSD